MFNFKGRPDKGSSSEQPRAYKSGPRQGSTAAPSYAELRNPTLVTSAISLDTNVTTSVPILVRPWVKKWEQKMRQGSILFVFESEMARDMQTVVDIPVLNYMLENSKNTTDDRNKTKDFVDAGGIANFKFNLFGIMRNDLLADSSLQKLYNVDVFGRAMVANIFGKVKRSDHVGLAIVEVNSRGIYKQFYQPNGAPTSYTDGLIDDNGIVMQVVGTVNGEIEDESYRDATIRRRYPLGVVSHAVAKKVTPGQIRIALRNQDQYMLLPRIEILMI